MWLRRKFYRLGNRCKHLIDTLDTTNFNLAQTYFELFDLPLDSQPDQALLREKYMVLQRQFHPDKFASADDQRRRQAVQIASFVNQANQTLSDPLKCAEYCLQLQGVEVDSETDAKMDPMFLMEQMEWRETLEDIKADDPGAFDQLSDLRTEINSSMDAIADASFAQIKARDTVEARNSIRKWQFLSKLYAEAESVEAKIDEL